VATAAPATLSAVAAFPSAVPSSLVTVTPATLSVMATQYAVSVYASSTLSDADTSHASEAVGAMRVADVWGWRG